MKVNRKAISHFVRKAYLAYFELKLVFCAFEIADRKEIIELREIGL